MSDGRKSHRMGFAGAVAALVFGATANAAIVAQADFGGGNGTASADQWTGAAGEGWSNGWSVPVNQDNGARMMTATVASASPLNGAGSYLSISNVPGDTLNGNKQSHVTRDVDFRSVAPTEISAVSFVVRLDQYVGGADYVTFYDVVNGGGSANPYLGAPHASWRVNLDTSGFWGAFAAAATKPTASTVARVVGDTYTVSLALDYAAGQYSATFTNLNWDASDGGTASQTLGNLAMKSNAGFGAEFAFGARVAASNLQSGESLNFSVDAIRIGTAAVPEPGAGMLVVTGVATLAAQRRRRGDGGRMVNRFAGQRRSDGCRT